MRGKEDSPDYRYFPEPDLPTLRISSEEVSGQFESLPEMPEIRQSRWLEEYGLPEREIVPLMARRSNGDYLESLISEGVAPVDASNWFRGEILRYLNDRSEKIEKFPVSAVSMAGLIKAAKEDRFSVGSAKKLLQQSLEEDTSLDLLVEQAGEQVQDEDELASWVDQVLSENPDAVEKIRSGDDKPMGFLMGQVMRLSAGQAHPRKVQEIIQSRVKK